MIARAKGLKRMCRRQRRDLTLRMNLPVLLVDISSNNVKASSSIVDYLDSLHGTPKGSAENLQGGGPGILTQIKPPDE